jgi:hypothetical protein
VKRKIRVEREKDVRITRGIEIFTNHVGICETDGKGEGFREFAILNINRVGCGQEIDVIGRWKEVNASIEDQDEPEHRKGTM